MANRNSDDVSILFNNGDGTFGPGVAYGAGDGPAGVAAADLDGDRDPDLVVANAYGSDVSVLLNNGDRTFGTDVTYESGGPTSQAWSVALADLDGDLDPDLVVANVYSNDVSVLSNICESRRCSADLDGDGDGGTSDLLALLAAWGSDPAVHPTLTATATSARPTCWSCLPAGGRAPEVKQSLGLGVLGRDTPGANRSGRKGVLERDHEPHLLDREGRQINGPCDRLSELAAQLDREGVRLKLPEAPLADAAGKANVGTACHPAPQPAPHDSLRPKRFEDIVGQDALVAELSQAVHVARESGEPLGHTLLIGGAGLGKTSIAGVVASELEADLSAACGPHIKEPSELVEILIGLGERAVLFIDEIHAVPGAAVEVLYEAMEDFRLSLPGAGVGTACQPCEPWRLRPFTLIAATTEPGGLPGPLLSRFENRHWIGPYTPDAIARVIERAAQCMGIPIDSDAARRLAAASRGTPREALRLLRKARRQARADGLAAIDGPAAARAMAGLGIDERGLNELDRAYLDTLAGHGPVGLARLAAMLGVDARVLERDHEPHLFRLGLATTTAAGRVLLRAG